MSGAMQPPAPSYMARVAAVVAAVMGWAQAGARADAAIVAAQVEAEQAEQAAGRAAAADDVEAGELVELCGALESSPAHDAGAARAASAPQSQPPGSQSTKATVMPYYASTHASCPWRP